MLMRRRAVLRLLMLFVLGLLMLSLAACGDDNATTSASDPVTPWSATAVSDSYLTSSPVADKHDGGWVYSAREKVFYAIYGNSDPSDYSLTLYRIDHVNGSASAVATSSNNRHGGQPVIDDTGSYIYLPPASYTSQLERYNTTTATLETLAAAPTTGAFSHGAWKNGKLWIVLSDYKLYSYDPTSNSWSAALQTFTTLANVATSGSQSQLIYVIRGYAYGSNSALYSYNTSDGTLTTLAEPPGAFSLDGNAEFTWFGAVTGYLYAASTNGATPAIYNIADNSWHTVSDPYTPTDYSGHATYDSTLKRLYFVGGNDNAYYYQY